MIRLWQLLDSKVARLTARSEFINGISHKRTFKCLLKCSLLTPVSIDCVEANDLDLMGAQPT
jgi:hypothetical protein